MNINKESYNKIAKKWSKNRSITPVNKCVIDFSSKIKKNGKILDIGCGSGYPIDKYLSDKGFSIVGIDNSIKLLQIAINQNIPNTKYILCDFFEYKPLEKYDGIVAFDVFFHFNKETQENIYKKISGWINKGAYLLFTHGNKNSEKTGTMFGEKFYYSALSTEYVHKLLIDAGFEVEISIENYIEDNNNRDLLILARKIN